jgi:hypothetical protein
MEDELEHLCKKISLIKGEQIGILVFEGDVFETKSHEDRCLIGKIWTMKIVNKEAFKTVLSRLWLTIGRVIFKEVQDNMWLFEFTEREDKKRVLAGRPWSFNCQIIVLNDFDETVPPSQMDFSQSPFWIQAHDMPLLYMTKGVGTKIGNSMGTLHEVDVAGNGVGWGQCLGMQVTMDLTKPLDRGRALNFAGKSQWISFKYEKLPMLCYHCGRIVHGRQGCLERQSGRLNSNAMEKQWGEWLQVDEPRH